MRLGTIDEMSVRQPHRKRVKHFHEPGDLHELTFSCYRRLSLLTNDDWRCRLSRCLDQAIQEAAMIFLCFLQKTLAKPVAHRTLPVPPRRKQVGSVSRNLPTRWRFVLVLKNQGTQLISFPWADREGEVYG